MKSVLSLTLYNENEKILEIKDVEYHKEKEEISFVHDNITYTIGTKKEKQYFIRESDEFTFSLDITKRTCTYLLKETNTMLDVQVIDCSLEQRKNEIILEYDMESTEGKNKVHIDLKEGEYDAY